MGGTNVSNAQSQSGANINSSGWVVGKGKATGGSLSAGNGLPTAAYISLAVIALSWVYFKNKKAGK